MLCYSNGTDKNSLIRYELDSVNSSGSKTDLQSLQPRYKLQVQWLDSPLQPAVKLMTHWPEIGTCFRRLFLAPESAWCLVPETMTHTASKMPTEKKTRNLS